MIFKLDRQNRRSFTTIENESVDDRHLSLEALGLHHYLMSKPEHWTVNYLELERRFEKNTKNRIRIAMRELSEAGYAVLADRKRSNKLHGKQYHIYETTKDYKAK